MTHGISYNYFTLKSPGLEAPGCFLYTAIDNHKIKKLIH